MTGYINGILDSIPVLWGVVLFYIIPFIVHFSWTIFNRNFERFCLKNVAALLFLIYYLSFIVGYVWCWVLYYIRVGNVFLICFFALILASAFVACLIADIRSLNKHRN